MNIRSFALEDRYRFDGGGYYLNGIQALVRLTILELRRRKAQGRKTAVYASGYRGSPLGTFDMAMQQASAFLGSDIILHPAVNEDLAATALWGTQQLGTFGGKARYDGVSGLWYGKGPGVDRTGDVFKHANLAGTSREGGVLAVAGDDHTCKSSTTAHSSEFALVDAWIPILVPSSLSEILEYGLIGWELSRFAGLWCGLKLVTEIVDSSESLAQDPIVEAHAPAGFEFPQGGLALRWPDTALAQEERLHQYKLPAALAYARHNRLDRVVIDNPNAKMGIITVGKSHPDTLQALKDLGIEGTRAAALGVRLYKVAMPWPLEPQGVREFARGLREIIVVEEKRGLVENQVRQHLYGIPGAPRIVGKHDEGGASLFPSNGDLDSVRIARVIGERLLSTTDEALLRARWGKLIRAAEAASRRPSLAARPAYFCPGCPHNSSTRIPDGSEAFAGIGCHYLVLPMERHTQGVTHMGGEGANWIGLSRFVDAEHVFQNIGDGTYFHSGSLAIRAAIAANVNVTYKVLYNGAVAMTGGQPMDGDLTPARIAEQVIAEGARRVVVVSDDPERTKRERFAIGVSVRHRNDLDAVQRELRAIRGVTVIIYDQSCATELRRMRKRGKIADPNVAVLINDLVCEGCGDCSAKSNCLSVVPVETEFGRKRAVDLSTCNKDHSCLEGFCPSFVTVEGGRLRQSRFLSPSDTDLPDPPRRALEDQVSIIVTGIGGTGVVTIGALLGVAAHLEGKAVRVMDMTGLAQKGGAVVSHVQIATGGVLLSSRISVESAHLMLGCDAVVAAAPENLARVSREKGHIIANDHETITGLFTRDADFVVPLDALRGELSAAVQPGRAEFCDATELATRLVGDAVGANLFLVGYAWQRGLIPLSLRSLHAAIELNAVAIALNKTAFSWGRRAASDLPAVRRAAFGEVPAHHRLSMSVEETIRRRADFLTDYQDADYARRFTALVEEVRVREEAVVPGSTRLTNAVARTAFRLMAYKDEYEVARLHVGTGFLARIREQFDGPYKIYCYLAPPLFAKRDPHTGELRKRRYGPWMIQSMKWLAHARRLRGTPFDIFGYTRERRAERQLIHDYFALVRQNVLPLLTARTIDAAVELAGIAETIRGYGHIKERSRMRAEQQQHELLIRLQDSLRSASMATSRLTNVAETLNEP